MLSLLPAKTALRSCQGRVERRIGWLLDITGTALPPPLPPPAASEIVILALGFSCSLRNPVLGRKEFFMMAELKKN